MKFRTNCHYDTARPYSKTPESGQHYHTPHWQRRSGKMPRRAAKVDSNQAEIVAALRAAGAQVFPTHGVGADFPDLVVCHQMRNILIEVVGPDKLKRFPPDGLSPGQRDFHRTWNGPCFAVCSIDEALNAINVVRVGGRIS